MDNSNVCERNNSSIWTAPWLDGSCGDYIEVPFDTCRDLAWEAEMELRNADEAFDAGEWSGAVQYLEHCSPKVVKIS